MLGFFLACSCASTEANNRPAIEEHASVSTGTPTYEEYYQAAQAAVACMNDRGATAVAVESERQSISIDISISSDRAGELDGIYDECYAEHLDGIELAFQTSISPSPENVIDSLRACLLDLGLAEPDTPDEDLYRIIDEHASEGDPLRQDVLDCQLDANQPEQG